MNRASIEDVTPVADTFGRPLRSLRISVTDRCNLRCQYCMPEVDYSWLPRANILSFEEIGALVDVFLDAGVRKLRLTGGEPLLRRDLPALVRLLSSKPRVTEIALTTNGVLLASQAEALRDAGLHRITVSLDTLRPDRHLRLARHNGHDKVLDAIRVARDVFGSLKLDAVMIRGVNDDEMVELLEYAKRAGAEIRFIEYMDVAGASSWSEEQVLSRREMLDRLAGRYGKVEPVEVTEWAPADRFSLPDGTIFGIIGSTTEPFCRTCDRSRLTADGVWYRCLYAEAGTDLRTPLRNGVSREELRATIEREWRARDDRGAELRAQQKDRRAYVPLTSPEGDPHLQMHTRGG
ncbi:MAG: GTP 3',8-cyclase MoaA [Vicinamibacterales bacterium]